MSSHITLGREVDSVSTPDAGAMNTSRTAVVASVATVSAWTAKAIAIGIAGGLGRSPLEGPLFLAGFGCMLVAVSSTGLAATAGRRRSRRALAVVGAVVGAVVVTVVTGAVVAQVEPARPGWAWGEVNLWVLALAAIAAAAVVDGRHRTQDRA